MKPGRPPLQDKLNALEHQLGIAFQKIAALESCVIALQAKQETVSPADKAYIPQFTSWAQTRGG